jgi:hypothetical protein
VPTDRDFALGGYEAAFRLWTALLNITTGARFAPDKKK